MLPIVTPGHKATPVEVLQAEIRRACGAFNLEPAARAGLIAGDLTTRRVGFFNAITVGLDACKVQRCARSIRRDPGEYFFLLIQDKGNCRVLQEGRSVELSPGDMFLVDSVRPSCFTYDGESSTQISIHMPRDEILRRVAKACAGGAAITRTAPLWQAIRAVIANMLAEPGTSSQLSEALLCLMGAHFHGIETGGERQPATLLSRAVALIDRCCTDPSFGPREMARKLNVSERMLQRHFQTIGETPGHRLLSRRLETAHSRLVGRTPAQAAEGIAAVAYDSGFNDLSYFYREFRKKYGGTPGAVAHCH